MMKISFAYLALCLGVTFHARAQSPENVTFPPVTYESHTYKLTLTTGSWTASESAAEAMGGHLVSITSQGEQSFIESTFLASGSPVSNYPLWIGLTDMPAHDSKSYVVWTTGEPVTYTNFYPGEPNNLQSNEDYVALNWHYSFGDTTTKGQWDDLPDGGSTASYNDTNARALGPYYGIVEIPGVNIAVPEPGTGWLLAVGACAGLGMVARKRFGTASGH